MTAAIHGALAGDATCVLDPLAASVYDAHAALRADYEARIAELEAASAASLDGLAHAESRAAAHWAQSQDALERIDAALALLGQPDTSVDQLRAALDPHGTRRRR